MRKDRAGADAKAAAEGGGEVAGMAVAAFIGGQLHAVAIAQQLMGELQTTLTEIVEHRGAEMALELGAQTAGAHRRHLGELLEMIGVGGIVTQMSADLFQSATFVRRETALLAVGLRQSQRQHL